MGDVHDGGREAPGGRLRARDHRGGDDGPLVLGHPPRLAQLREGAVAHLLQVRPVEVDRLDGKPAPHPVEQIAEKPLARLGRRPRQQRMPRGPLFLIGRALGERGVADAEEPKLFEVGVREAPPSAQIVVEPVAEHVAQRLPRPVRLRALGVWRARVVAGRQAQVVQHLVRQHVVHQRAARLVAQRREERPAQEQDHHEVVEVPGLKGGVLPVVGEAEQLAGGLRQRRVAEEVPHRRYGEDRGRARPPLGRQRAELRSLAADRAVEDRVALAVEAEAEGLGDEPTGQAALVGPAAGCGAERRRAIGPEVLAKPQRAVHGWLQPLLRVAVRVVGVEHAFRVGHKVSVHGTAVVVGAAAVAELSRRDVDWAPVRHGGPNGEVFLTARAAKYGAEERLSVLSGLELLAVEGDVAVLRRLQRDKDVSRPRDELVQAESEEGPPVRAGCSVGQQEEAADVVEALGLGPARRPREERGRLGERLGLAGANPPPVRPSVLALETKGGLDPRRDGVPPQGVELRRRGHPGGDGGGQRIAPRPRRLVRDALEALRDDVLGADLRAEQPGGDRGHRAVALIRRPAARHRRARADAQ